MSRFFFARSAAADLTREQEADGQVQLKSLASALMEAQSVTVAAIFAALVGKGVFTAAEASDHMREIARALKIDVRSSTDMGVGSTGSHLLESYARALTVAQN